VKYKRQKVAYKYKRFLFGISGHHLSWDWYTSPLPILYRYSLHGLTS